MFLAHLPTIRLKQKVCICALITTTLGFNAMKATADSDNNYEYILKNYSESQKSQIKRVISFTTQKHTGKVLGISLQNDNDEQYFKVKLLNPQGQLKTYYLNKSISEISP